MKFIIAILALSLTGCASQLQAVKGMQSAAAVSLRAAEDNQLDLLVFGICATPYSALIRHPEIVPGVGALCLPNGNLTNPANLLYAIPAKP
jgi:hypothetical protein